MKHLRWEFMKHVQPSLSVAAKYVASSCWDGIYYASHSKWQFHVASIALGYMQIPNNAKILDIGCGDGRFTKHFAGFFPDSEVLGLDSAPSMVAAAQANAMPNLSFILGNATNLPFRNQFDRIVAFNSLHWVSKINIALEQMRNALVPGGQILILVAPIQVRHQLHQIIDQVAKQQRWCDYFGNRPSVFSFYTLAEWATLIEEAGMIPENLKLIDVSFDYPEKQSFADSIAAWIPFGTIPEDKKSEYVQDVVEAYINAYPCDPNGVVHYHLDELVIIASKKLVSN
jgi:trans-aconitate methyltransferase